jgi:hypothetical protein
MSDYDVNAAFEREHRDRQMLGLAMLAGPVMHILASRAKWGWRTVTGEVSGSVFDVRGDTLWATQTEAEKSVGGAVTFHAVPVLRIQGFGETTITEAELAALGRCPNL